MTDRITPEEAKARIHDGGEIAFLDVREPGQFGEGHPLFAVPCPFSRLEQTVPRLVPRKTVRVLLIDAGDGVSERAASSLSRLGYGDVALVEEGTLGWQTAGLILFKGVNVPSKALGELAEAEWHPDTVDAATARRWLDHGQARVFDARPPSEFHKMHVPGAACVPNGELPHRLAAVDPGEETPIVISCAGRTRGLLGAINMRLCGFERPVYALENGTQGWALTGYELRRGEAASDLPALDDATEDESRARATALIRDHSLPRLDSSEVVAMLGDTASTTFVFDVRSHAEVEIDPVPVATHALGGQLVQATDQYVGVRHARILLLDDTGLRASLAAFWLRKLGYHPFVCTIDETLRSLRPSERRIGAKSVLSRDARPANGDAGIEPDEAPATISRGGALLVDLRSSRAYRQAHIRGAVWSTRARLPRLVAREGPVRVLLMADEEMVAANARADLAEHGVDAAVIRGGHTALVAAGLPTATTPDVPDDAEAIDFLLFVHDRHDGNLEASRAYLAWETGLIPMALIVDSVGIPFGRVS